MDRFEWVLKGDEWEETFDTQQELIDSVLVWEAFSCWHNGVDVTDDCAALWVHFNGTEDAPPIFWKKIDDITWQATLAESVRLRG